jgi:hypothetical protein
VRRFALLLALLALGAPAAASADDGVPVCRLDPETPASARVDILVDEGLASHTEALAGGQYTAAWLGPGDAGWFVGIAPGPDTLDAVAARLADYIAATYKPEDAQFLRERLHVVAQPYSKAELDRVQAALVAQAIPLGVTWSLGEGCQDTDGYRVEFHLFDNATGGIFAAAQRMAAPYGDMVVVRRLPGGISPTAGPAPVAAPLVLPRCATGRTLRLRAPAGGRILSVTVGGRATRTRMLTAPRRGSRLVRVTARLADGRAVTRSVRLRRC